MHEILKCDKIKGNLKMEYRLWQNNLTVTKVWNKCTCWDGENGLDLTNFGVG